MQKIISGTLALMAGILDAQQKPNIIFILTDDMGWMDAGCYGNPFNETPNIDSLAKTGIRFTNAYSSCPVSSPSRAGMLTGKYPARLQLTNFIKGERTDPKSPVLPANWKPYLETEEKTIAEVLKEQGYATGHVGKWHVGSEESQAPWNQGFEYSRMIGKNGLDYYNYSIYLGDYEHEFIDNGKNYLTDTLTGFALDFISQNNSKPFYLYLAYSAPHVMTVPRADKLKKYFFKYANTKYKYNSNYAAQLESVDDGVGAIMN